MPPSFAITLPSPFIRLCRDSYHRRAAEHGKSTLADLRPTFGITLDGSFGLPRLSGRVSGEPFGLLQFANLAIWSAPIPAVLRLWMKRLTGFFAVRSDPLQIGLVVHARFCPDQKNLAAVSRNEVVGFA